MPSRIIRESALTSPSINRMTEFEERLWWRLTLVADDHGRFDAHPDVVRARCFPRLLATYSEEQVKNGLDALGKLGGIKRYRVEGRTYGYFVNWERYQRAPRSASKFPNPPQLPAIARKLQTNAADCGVESLVVSRYSLSENREAGSGKRGSGGETHSPSFLSPSNNQRDRERREIQEKLRKKGLDH